MIQRLLYAALTASFLLVGCATPETGGGRYMQLYKDGFISSEFDMVTNHGCTAGVKEMLRKLEETKKLGGSASCAYKSARDSLPVIVSISHPDEPRVTRYRMASMTVCKSSAEETMKSDPKLKISCEVEQKQ